MGLGNQKQRTLNLKTKIKELAEAGMTEAYQISDKMERKDAVVAVTEKAASRDILAADEEQDQKELLRHAS